MQFVYLFMANFWPSHEKRLCIIESVIANCKRVCIYAYIFISEGQC